MAPRRELSTHGAVSPSRHTDRLRSDWATPSNPRDCCCDNGDACHRPGRANQGPAASVSRARARLAFRTRPAQPRSIETPRNCAESAADPRWHYAVQDGWPPCRTYRCGGRRKFAIFSDMSDGNRNPASMPLAIVGYDGLFGHESGRASMCCENRTVVLDEMGGTRRRHTISPATHVIPAGSRPWGESSRPYLSDSDELRPVSGRQADGPPEHRANPVPLNGIRLWEPRLAIIPDGDPQQSSPGPACRCDTLPLSPASMRLSRIHRGVD